MAELVAKTSAAVAVDDSLTTLLDWTNIESLAGFTIIVENAGGGSANDITDVQIDTSDNGGVTSNLDQHAGVPAVPITSGNAKPGTFTETAKFVRVRALCTADEDTTANAILLADSATGRICTLADLKERLGLTDTDHDITLGRINTGIEGVFNSFTNRQIVMPAADVTEYYTACGPQLQLKRYPIISITSIKQAVNYDFASATALTANTDYRLINGGAEGIIYSIYSNWFGGPDCIEIIYRGGYCAAGQTPGTGETAMPADLREAAIEQSSFLFKRKDDIYRSEEGTLFRLVPVQDLTVSDPLR